MSMKWIRPQESFCSLFIIVFPKCGRMKACREETLLPELHLAVYGSRSEDTSPSAPLLALRSSLRGAFRSLLDSEGPLALVFSFLCCCFSSFDSWLSKVKKKYFTDVNMCLNIQNNNYFTNSNHWKSFYRITWWPQWFCTKLYTKCLSARYLHH